MSEIFGEIFLRPLFNLLVIIYNVLPAADLGIAVIFMTLIVRIILWPFFSSAAKSQITFSKLQPEVERIQKKYKDDKAAQTQELLALYKREKFNPFSGFFVILIQIPIIIALYQVFLRGVKLTDFSLLYPWIKNPGSLDPMFLGWINLTQPFFVFAILAGIAQFFQTKQITPKKSQTSSFSSNISRQMLWIGPILTILILKGLPSVIALYWTVTSIFSIFQQCLLEKKLKATNE
ncbi:MAG: YidC/Oxa1 family membrane protein insertase [Candidatus Paceibacteria bacterium]